MDRLAPHESNGQTTAVLPRPISTAPLSFSPPLSLYNHHAPAILLYMPLRRWVVGEWGGPSNPYWVYKGEHRRLEEDAVYWAPLPYSPNELDYEERTGEKPPTAHRRSRF
jgi:hypothetical protein